MAIVEFGLKGQGLTNRVEGLTLMKAKDLSRQLVRMFTGLPNPGPVFTYIDRRNCPRESWEDCNHWVTIIK